MAKSLRVLTILLLILSIGALTLGTLLFAKREILKGRTQKLENAVITLSAFLEDGEAEPAENSFSAKDVSEVRAETEFEPERSDFWFSYKLQLEDTDRPPVIVNRPHLMSYYMIDPIDLKVKKDPMGNPITSGTGTTGGELTRIIAAAEAQYGRLNDTRIQLQDIRRELIASIDELNSRKASLREKLAHINHLNGTIAGLENDVSRLESNVARLQEEKQDLEGEVEQQQVEIAELEERLTEADEVIVDLRERIEILGQDRARAGPSIDPGGLKDLIVMQKGRKGTVVAVNPDWKYCVVQINEAFIEEIEGMQRAMEEEDVPGLLPAVELHVKRGLGFETYVTKVRLSQLVKDEMLAICDIDPKWEQIPVAKGDVVFH